MSREQLQALASDVDRLVAAGSTVAPGDEKLRARAKTMRQLGEKVPVLAQVADAVERVTGSEPKQASQALLDLLPVIRQIRASITTAGSDGALQPVESAGPWKTTAPAHDLYPLVEALAASGQGRLQLFKDAVERGICSDLRLAESMLAGLGDGYGELADYLAEQAIPAFGPAILGDVRRGLNLDGKTVDGRRLLAGARIDPKLGLQLCRQAFEEGSAPVKLFALRAYPTVAPEEAEKVLLERLGQEKSVEIRSAIVQALGELTQATGAAIAALVAALKDKKLCHLASRALGNIGKPAVQPLIEALADPDPSARGQAMQALQYMGQQASPAVAALIKALDDKDKEARHAALAALGSVGPDAQAAVAAIAKLLESKEPQDRWDAATALGHIGPAAKPAIPALIACLKDKEEVVNCAALALGQIGPQTKAVVPALVELLSKGKSSDMRRHAVLGLGKIGAADKEVISAIASALEDKDDAVVYSVVELLGELGGEQPKIAVPALVGILEKKKKHDYYRYYVIQALGKLGAKAKEAAPALTKIRDADTSDYLSRAAGDALLAIQAS